MRRRALRRNKARLVKPVVEGVEKRILLATFTVINTTDTTNPGSLRWAIGESNATSGSNTIDFDIPGSGVQSIAITSELPALTVPVTIDGTTQPGYSSKPLIEIDGAGAGNSGGGVDGLDVEGGNSTIKGLDINQFSGNGISLSMTGGDTIEDDFIGTDATGTTALGNSLAGVTVLVNSNNNVITDNLISGNLDNGIYLNGQEFGATNPVTSGNLVTGNLLGTNVSGTGTLGNDSDGIAIQNAPLTTIGGTTAAARNIVSGNGAGMELFDNSDDSVIEGNYIGTDITGEVALGNDGSDGFFNDDMVFRGISNSTIGGTVPGAGNVISGGTNYGIDCFVIGSENLAIQGNLIGTDATGTKALGNKSGGIEIAGPSGVTIGGTVVGARNVISGNTGNGIGTFANGAGLTIQGNFIGTDITGTQPLGNGGDGIQATYPGITIGGLGPGAANVIANNGFVDAFDHSGVDVTNDDTPVLSNSIYGNMLNGIELDGGNNGQVAPVLTSASATPTSSTIDGTLTASAGTYTVQFFSVPTLDASNKAEGKVLIGTSTVTITGTSATFSESFADGFTPGSLITATATDASGNTSEFSASVTASGTGQFLVDPTITVSGPTGEVPAGEAAVYTYTITNPSNVNEQGVEFYAPIPAGTTFDSGTVSSGAAVAVSEGQVTAYIGMLDIGQSVTVTVVLTPGTGAIPSFVNLGSVASTTPSLLPGIVTASTTTTIVPSSDLSVTIPDVSGTTAVGDQLSYTVTVTNNGASNATGVVLSDILPTGTTFVSATPTSGPAVVNSDGVLTDNYGDLAAGASFSLTIIVSVDLDAYPLATDSASVTADQPDPNMANNSASASATITLVSDVGVTIVPGSTNIGVDQTQTYTVTVTNHGPSPALDVSLTDDLPSNSTFVSASSSSGTPPTHSGNIVADLIGTLDSGDSVVVTILVTATASSATTLTDTASVTTTSTDPITTNNSATSITTIYPIADLAITSIVASPTPVLQGQETTFTIEVENYGPSTATSATVTDTLPAGLTFATGSVNGGVVTSAGQVVTAALGDLPSGTSEALTIEVLTTATGTFTNTATIASPVVDPALGNNTTSTTVTVNPVVDLTVTLSGYTGPVFTGNPLVFTAIVNNNGPSEATNVLFTDTLFPGAVLQQIIADGNYGTLDNNQAIVSIGDLPAGASATVVLTVIPDQVGTFSSAGSVTSDDPDSNPSNNSASIATTVIAPYQNISFTSTTYSVLDSAVFAAITFERAGDTAVASTVHFSTVGGTATAGVDYQPVSSIVSFPAGTTTATVDVPVLDNINAKANELVELQLDTPTNGALLLAPGQNPGPSPIGALLDIVDPNPILVGPTVTDLKLIGTVSNIDALEVDTTGDLNPATADYPLNYSIIALGGGGKTGLAAGTFVPVVGATYNAATGAIILNPATPLPANELFQIALNGGGPTAISDLAGNPLNSVQGVTPGSDYLLDVARGTNLTYTDQNDTTVNIKLTGPGTIDIDRTITGVLGRLQVLGAVAGKTVVTGTVHGGNHQTTIGTILGIGDFGSIHFNLTTPPFYYSGGVVYSAGVQTDAAAVDTLLTPPPTPVKKSSKPVKVSKPKVTTKTVKAEAIASPDLKAESLIDPTPRASTSHSSAKTTIKTAIKHPTAAMALAIRHKAR